MTMIMNLSKKNKHSKLDDSDSRRGMERSQSPYTLFYTQSNEEGEYKEMQIVPPQLDPVQSPEYRSRTASRTKKRMYFEEQDATFKYFESSNLVTVHRAFLQVAAEDGTLQRTTFVKAMQSLNVSDLDRVNRTFDLFDPSKSDCVEYREVIQALDVILNGTNKQITAKNCFQLFDPTNCGYIIQPCVHQIKEKRQEVEGINHMMVKVLLEIFDRLQKEYEEKLRKEWNKKNKSLIKKILAEEAKKGDGKGKGKDGGKGKKDEKGEKGGKPKVEVVLELPQFSPKIHLSFDEFCHFFSTEPLLVQSFVPVILKTMEQVYLRNSKVVEKVEEEPKEKKDKRKDRKDKEKDKSKDSKDKESKEKKKDAEKEKEEPKPQTADGDAPSTPPPAPTTGATAEPFGDVPVEGQQ